MAGTNYYAAVTAAASQNFLGSTSPPGGPAMASVILKPPPAPTLTGRDDGGNVDCHVFDFSECSDERRDLHAQGLYERCDDQPVRDAEHELSFWWTLTVPFTPGTAGTPYYVTITPNASTGYLVNATSTSPRVSATRGPKFGEAADARDRITFGDHRGGDRGHVHQAHRQQYPFFVHRDRVHRLRYDPELRDDD